MRLALIALLALAWLPGGAAHAHPSEAHRIEQLSEAIEASPGDASLYLRRGRSHANEDRLELALLDLRKAEALGDPVLAAYDLGVVLYRKGDLDGARAAFTRWLERFPEHGQALQYRARVARDAGDPAAALADFEAYFALQPSPNPGDFVSAARLLETGGQGEGAALAMLDRGIERLGVIPQLQQPAIALERRRGRLDAAIARQLSLEAALDDSPDWKVELAELLREAGRGEEASALLEAAARQLDGLRSTAARRALRARIEALRAGPG